MVQGTCKLGYQETDEDLSSRKVTSHSMKCTMLSYCAKYGVPTLDRLILGYHTGNASTAPQMRILDEVLEAIRDGKFCQIYREASASPRPPGRRDQPLFSHQLSNPLSRLRLRTVEMRPQNRRPRLYQRKPLLNPVMRVMMAQLRRRLFGSSCACR